MYIMLNQHAHYMAGTSSLFPSGLYVLASAELFLSCIHGLPDLVLFLLLSACAQPCGPHLKNTGPNNNINNNWDFFKVSGRLCSRAWSSAHPGSNLLNHSKITADTLVLTFPEITSLLGLPWGCEHYTEFQFRATCVRCSSHQHPQFSFHLQ